tara:strand:+ start:465 stop:1388 length:924 start_codon:yes stop_codon:yes gene_type:complete
MNLNNLKHSLKLYSFDEKFDLMIKLYNSKKFPNSLMLSGKKGIGKFTLVKHFLNYIFDKKYNLETKEINETSEFYRQYLNNVTPNVIYLDGFELKNAKIDDIRHLKSTLLKSNISGMSRFIILDDVELFNHNSLNALLKIIEEPNLNNFFILINNNSKPIIETIKSRCLEFKLSLKNKDRLKIIDSLIKKNNLDTCIDYKSFSITPGNFYIFNNICKNNNININGDFLLNLEKILNLYKKEKDMNLINLLIYITEIYFYKLSIENRNNLEKNSYTMNYIIDNLNKFTLLNLNPNSLKNSITNELSNE